jgi:hypothetical protein
MATLSHPFAVENRKQSANHYNKDFESLLSRRVDREYTRICVLQVNVSTGRLIGRIFPSVRTFPGNVHNINELELDSE